MFYSVVSQCVFTVRSVVFQIVRTPPEGSTTCAVHMGTVQLCLPISDLPFHSAKTVLNYFLKGEEEDQFLKDSAQDLKNRRNKNKVGLPSPEVMMSNIYSRSRDRSLVRSVAAVGTTVTGARGGGDRR